MHRDHGQSSFADALVRCGGNPRLERIAGLLDWTELSQAMSDIYGAGRGRPSYAPILLFRILLLQGWYDLSDPMMEEALGDRLSFRRFCGLGLEERVPDHSTISRFRTLLAECGLAQTLFALVERQLDTRGVMVKTGTLIDATLIDAAAAEPHRQKGGGRSQADPDARWMKRPDGGARFGYKLHIAVDHGSNIVRRAILTPANVADVDKGHELVIGDERAVYADKPVLSLSKGPMSDRACARGWPKTGSRIVCSNGDGRIAPSRPARPCATS